jgi:hypothetical protein
MDTTIPTIYLSDGFLEEEEEGIGCVDVIVGMELL